MTQHPTNPPVAPGPVESTAATDDQHLKTLAIIYYVFSGLNLFGVCCGVALLLQGIIFGSNPQMFEDPSMTEEQSRVLRAIATWLPTGFGIVMLVTSILSGCLLFCVGRCLNRRSHHLYCLVIAGLECVSFPLGTLLGIFTFIVLLRPSVKAEFDAVRDAKLAGQAY